MGERWMGPQRFAVVVVAALCLAACGGSGTAETAPESPAAPQAMTTTSRPADTEVTAEQVASVIAGYESNWRKTIDEAGDCRFLSVMGEGPLDEASLMACYTGEVAMGISAGNSIRELSALNVPPSMVDLVAETTRVLQAVADVDLEGACGPPMAIPTGDDCSHVLGERFTLYQLLESTLDRWRPYL